MKLSDYLKTETIISDLKAKDKYEALREIVKILHERGILDAEKPYLEALIKREKLCSTGIGRGVAIPHAKMKEIKSIIVSFAKSKEGVDFESVDDLPVHYIFTIFTPEDVPEEYLLILARISKIAKDEEFRRNIEKATSVEDFIEIFKAEDEKFEKAAG